MSQRASVIIATRNKARHLALSLASYVKQTSTDFDIIVVDDGSDDDTAQVVAEASRRIPVSYVGTAHGGRAAARNRGIEVATGDLIIFSDDDRLVVPDFIAAHLSANPAATPCQLLGWQYGMLSVWDPLIPIRPATLWAWMARNHQRVETAGAPLFGPDDVIERFAAIVADLAFPERWWEEGVVPALAAWGEDLHTMSIPWVLGTTGNLSVPRATLVEIGCFDARFAGWGLEDLDLCYRLHRHGLGVQVSRRAASYHQAHRTSPTKRSEWLRNLVHLVRTHKTLEVALYARELSRNHVADWKRLDADIRATRAECPTPAVAEALRLALAAVVERRIHALESSGGTYLLGVSQADW